MLRVNRHRIPVIGAFVVSVIALVTYQPGLQLGFFADDFKLLDSAGRFPLAQYLPLYFDPLQQTHWYRPLQGIQWKTTFTLFGANPIGYHLLNILLHLSVCLLLYRIVIRTSKQLPVAFVAAALYACLTVVNLNNPNGERVAQNFWLYNLVVLWPAVVDPLEAIFYLLAIDAWLTYLERAHWQHFAFAMGANILALLCKEVGTTLVVVLFLVDRLLIGKPIGLPELVRRYIPFVLILLVYVPIALQVQSQSVFTQFVGYRLGTHILSNLAHYFQVIALPWGLTGWLSQVGLWCVAGVMLYLVAIKRNRRVLFFAPAATLTILPVGLFPFIDLRYLYLPLMLFAAAFAAVVATAQRNLRQHRWSAPVVSAFVALLILSNGIGVVNQVVDFSRIIAQSQEPLTPIFERHPSFPENTLLYFIDPPMLSEDLSGLFLLRYGRGVSVRGTDQGAYAYLHNDQHAFIFYFDDADRVHEQPVGAKAETLTDPMLPANFEIPMQLVGYDLAGNWLKRGDALVLITYWRAFQKIDKNYTVFVHLVDAGGRVIEGYDSEPQGGRAPTTSWRPGRLAVSSTVIPIQPDAPVGANYRLEVGMYYQPAMQRLMLLDAQGRPAADKIVIEPLIIVE